MNTEFEGDHPHEMIWVHSSGNMFSKFIYLEKSMVRQYLELAKKKIHSINRIMFLLTRLQVLQTCI